MDGLRLIVEAVQQRLIEASQAKAQGRTDWWKVSTQWFLVSWNLPMLISSRVVLFASSFLFLPHLIYVLN